MRPCYVLRRFFVDELPSWPNRLVWSFQRMFKGYDSRISWSPYQEIGETIIREMKKFKNGYRYGYHIIAEEGEDWEKIDDKILVARWEKVISDIIEGFEELMVEPTDLQCWKDYYEDKKITSEEFQKQEEEYYKNAKKKASLFIEHFHGLWD